MSDETATTDEDTSPKCPNEVLGLLWRAFSLRGCDDGTEKKGRLCRRFKALMEEARLYIQNANGSVTITLDPRGGLQFPPKMAQVFTPNVEEAELLQERVKELKEKKNADGSPFIDSTVSDHIDDIEKIWLPMWLVKAPETPALPAPAVAPNRLAAAEPVEATPA